MDRIVLAGLASITLAIIGASIARAEPPRCPDCNVVLISVDDLRADAVGFMGAPKGSTPNLDRWAAEGTVFTRAFSQAPNSLPSHMSIFTGLYPWHHKVRALYRDSLSDKIQAIGQLMEKAGYETVWALKEESPFLSREAGFQRGFERILPMSPGDHWQPVLDYLDGKHPRKFFIFMHSYRVHAPYHAERAVVEKLGGRYRPELTPSPAELLRLAKENPKRAYPEDVVRDHAAIFAEKDPEIRWKALEKLPERPDLAQVFFSLYDFGKPEDVAYLKLLYRAGVYKIDVRVGEVLDRLRKDGLLAKTVVIVTSDHGEEFLEHGKVMHWQLYGESLHVPLVVIAPEVPKGRRVESVAQSVDILPTILEETEQPIPGGLDGEPLFGRMRTAAGKPDCRLAMAGWNGEYALRDCDFTYILRRGGPGKDDRGTAELFDRRSDPGEARDVAAEKPEIAAKFEAAVKGLPKDEGGTQGSWPEWISPAGRKRIIETGYW